MKKTPVRTYFGRPASANTIRLLEQRDAARVEWDALAAEGEHYFTERFNEVRARYFDAICSLPDPPAIYPIGMGKR